MGSPTIGAQTAAIIGFLVVMFLLEPMMTLVLPAGQTSNFFGANSLVNVTYGNFVNKFQIPVLSQANSSSGFNAAGYLQSYSGLAFIYGALGLFWQSLNQFPTMILSILSGEASEVTFLPYSILTIVSIICFSYITIGNFYKILSSWQKSDIENVGG